MGGIQSKAARERRRGAREIVQGVERGAEEKPSLRVRLLGAEIRFEQRDSRLWATRAQERDGFRV